jgi:hypothetical protein
MTTAVYLLLAAALLLITIGRLIFQPAAKDIDWALEVAFVRLDFPQPYRDVAQQLAAGLAEIVGMKIKQLKPEHDLSEIAAWSADQIHAKDLITLFLIAFEVRCDPDTTFGDLVERVAQKKAGKA